MNLWRKAAVLRNLREPSSWSRKAQERARCPGPDAAIIARRSLFGMPGRKVRRDRRHQDADAAEIRPISSTNKSLKLCSGAASRYRFATAVVAEVDCDI